MGFLDAGGNGGIFLEISDSENKKSIRPLTDKPTSIWGHAFPSPETAVTLASGIAKMGRLRDYHFEICTATNRKGTGCRVCNLTDPAWQYLTARDQTNKKGQRVDFPKRCYYLMPVWSYDDNEVRVMVGGNQLYEGMSKFADDEGKDVRTCDWKVWKTGEGKMTKYESSRQDASTFTVQVHTDRIAEAMSEAMTDRYTPLKDDELSRKMQVLTPAQLKAQLESDTKAGAAPTAPALPAAEAPKQLTTGVDDAQISALRAVLPGKTDDELRAIIAASSGNAGKGTSGGPPGNFNVAPQVAHPAAQTKSEAVLEAPVIVPKKQENLNAAYEASNDPTMYVLEQGKHAGKKISELVVSDIKYVQYLRAQGYDDTVKSVASKLLDVKPAMPEPVQQAPATAAPTIPPVTTATGDVVQVEQPHAQASDAEEQRTSLVKECTVLVTQVKEFQGPGLSRNLIPFLKGINAKRLNYKEEWSVAELHRLKSKLNEKLGNVPANPHLSA